MSFFPRRHFYRQYKSFARNRCLISVSDNKQMFIIRKLTPCTFFRRTPTTQYRNKKIFTNSAKIYSNTGSAIPLGISLKRPMEKEPQMALGAQSREASTFKLLTVLTFGMQKQQLMF